MSTTSADVYTVLQVQFLKLVIHYVKLEKDNYITKFITEISEQHTILDFV